MSALGGYIKVTMFLIYVQTLSECQGHRFQCLVSTTSKYPHSDSQALSYTKHLPAVGLPTLTELLPRGPSVYFSCTEQKGMTSLEGGKKQSCVVNRTAVTSRGWASSRYA